jgi:catechol 2,3-dioxygenase-like lactoylglutathione lyase family enzyme
MLVKATKRSTPARLLLFSFCLLLFVFPAQARQTNGYDLVQAVAAIGMTVSDMDRALDFYTKVLTFEKASDLEAAGDEYEHLCGVFGLRIRVVRLQLGDAFIELTDFLAPEGRPIPVDMRSNDKWFQHIAIVVSDMDKAYQRLREFKVQHASTGPQRIPDWNKAAAGIRAFYFRDPDGHHLEIIYFPAGKGDSKWQVAGYFWGLIITDGPIRKMPAPMILFIGRRRCFATTPRHWHSAFAPQIIMNSSRLPPRLQFRKASSVSKKVSSCAIRMGT